MYTNALRESGERKEDDENRKGDSKEKILTRNASWAGLVLRNGSLFRRSPVTMLV